MIQKHSEQNESGNKLVSSAQAQQAQKLLSQAKAEIEQQGGRLILAVYAGSIAYGRSNPNSDLDLRGIYLPPVKKYLLCEQPEAFELEDGDVLFQPLNKFFRLAAGGNPNVLEWLFVRNEHILYCDPVYGKPILEARERFLSRKMIASFLGFAKGSWKDLQRMLEKTPDPDPSALYKMNKHASHISRLLTQLEEALAQQSFSTWHPTTQRALELVDGKTAFEPDFMQNLKDLKERIDVLEGSTRLPEKPDFAFLNDLQCRLAQNWICSSRKNPPKDQSKSDDLKRMPSSGLMC